MDGKTNEKIKLNKTMKHLKALGMFLLISIILGCYIVLTERYPQVMTYFSLSVVGILAYYACYVSVDSKN